MKTKVYWQENALLVDGLPPLPSCSLACAINADRVMVMGLNGFPVANLLFSEYARADGTGFATPASAKAYFDAEFDKSAWAAENHTHVIADVTGLQTALDGKQPVGSYAPASHTHTIAQVTGLQGALDGKQAAGNYSLVGHTHAIADVTGLQAALDAKLANSFVSSAPARTLNTVFQPNASKAVLASYTVKTQVTNPLLVGTSTATVKLLSDASNPPTTERARAEATSGVGITVTIAMTTSNTTTLTCLVPAGHRVKLESSTAGTGTVTLVAVSETVIG